MTETKLRKAIQAYLDSGGEPEFIIISKKDYEKNWRKYVRTELKKLFRVGLRAATYSTHDTLPVMIAMKKYCESKGVKI